VTIKGFLDKPGEVRVFTGQVIHSPGSDNLTGREDGIDYE
jgi:hypothetical protein